MDRGESKEARGGLHEDLGGLKTDLVPLAPERDGLKLDLGRLDADLFQSAGVVGGLRPWLVRQKKVGGRWEKVLVLANGVGGGLEKDRGGLEKVGVESAEVGFQSAAARS